jgi:hypothetical protein
LRLLPSFELLNMAAEFYFTPELHLKERVVRDLEDTVSSAREQEMRPEIDQRGEILHKLEWAATREEIKPRRTALSPGRKSASFSCSGQGLGNARSAQYMGERFLPRPEHSL